MCDKNEEMVRISGVQMPEKELQEAKDFVRKFIAKELDRGCVFAPVPTDGWGGQSILLNPKLIPMGDESCVIIWEDHGHGNDTAVLIENEHPVECTVTGDTYGQLRNGDIMVFKTSIGHPHPVMVVPSYD